jgi:hypothetical protein
MYRIIELETKQKSTSIYKLFINKTDKNDSFCIFGS